MRRASTVLPIHIQGPTAEEVETLAAALIAQAQVRGAIRPDRKPASDPYSVLVYVGCYLGLRWGELAGLKRSHVHLLKRQLRVVGSLERLKGGFRYVEETKTVNSRRTIPIPAFLAEMLALHLAAAPTSEYVFCTERGTFVNYRNFLRRYWHPGVARAELEPLTPHEMRHTAAALMIAEGANPVTVQRRLGHKDITTTLQLYGHLFPEQDDLLTARLDDLRARVSKARPVAEMEVVTALPR
jgi:integrase